MSTYRAAVFDMDGTILNTLTDLNLSLNYALGAAGHKSDWSNEDTALFFGSGIQVAIRRALLCEAGRIPCEEDAVSAIGTEADHPTPEETSEALRVKEIFTPFYNTHCNDHTAPYPGIPEAIRTIRCRGIHTSVVSNKQDAAVQLLAENKFPGLFDVALGEKEGIRRKPAPDMVLAVLEQASIPKEEAVYIGDSEIDLRTATNAGMPCISVDWGFRKKSFLKKIGAQTIVSRPDEIISLITEESLRL